MSKTHRSTIRLDNMWHGGLLFLSMYARISPSVYNVEISSSIDYKGQPWMLISSKSQPHLVGFNVMVTRCGHLVCADCVNDRLMTARYWHSHIRCPICHDVLYRPPLGLYNNRTTSNYQNRNYQNSDYLNRNY